MCLCLFSSVNVEFVGIVILWGMVIFLGFEFFVRFVFGFLGFWVQVGIGS